ncbi:hypothetical protein K438DRAFT_1839702 [Mycena galopus ATCC 62051]|nr:hypothetical protein K438DRAFT_1839702 [Mycena galopus ATCC 62051]
MAISHISARFSAPDADIIILSSDGVLFKVHRKNLVAHSGVFEGAETATRPENGAEPVELTEPADVLGLLLQFMYAQPPDLQALEFRELAALAEAVEKYMVYSALPSCRTQMENSVCAHPLEVLVYALRHDYINLANESAQQSMRCDVAEAMEILSPEIFEDWIEFYDRWHRQTAKSLAYMVTFPKHVSLVQKCTADRNPACTFRKELDEAGGWSRTIREMKFVVDPRLARAQCFAYGQPSFTSSLAGRPVFSF